MCNSQRTVTTLRRYLSSIPELDRDAKPPPSESSLGGRDLLLARASEYFLWKGSIGKMTRNIRSAGSTANNVNYRKDPNQPIDYGAVLANANKPGGLASDKVPYESAALKRKSAYKHGQPINKRRRTRGGGAAGYNFEGRAANSKEKKPAGLSANILEAEAEELADKTAHEGAGVLPNSLQEPDEEFDAVAFNEYFGLCSVENTVIIRSYAGDEDDKVLEELRPRYVILYDPDPSYVRRIEVCRVQSNLEPMLISFADLSSCKPWHEG
jgi:DNA excision repair protein ERCC-4